MRNYDELHRRLLDEAAIILSGTDHQGFSLDAVAARAGVSKGGVLHHFPSKDAFCRAILAESAKAWTEMFMRLLAEIPGDEKGRWSKAYISMSFTKDEKAIRMGMAAERLLVKQPELCATYTEHFPDLVPDLPEDGLPEGRFDVIVAACDGIWLRQINGWTTADAQWNSKLERALRSLAE